MASDTVSDTAKESWLPVRDPGPRVPCFRCGTLRRTFVERIEEGLALECAACGMGLGATSEQVLLEGRQKHRTLLTAMHERMRGPVVEPRVTYWRGTVWIDDHVRVDGRCSSCRAEARLWPLWGELVCSACYALEELAIARTLRDGPSRRGRRRR